MDVKLLVAFVTILAIAQQSDAAVPVVTTTTGTIMNGATDVTPRITAETLINIFCTIATTGEDWRFFTIVPNTMFTAVSTSIGCHLSATLAVDRLADLKSVYVIDIIVHDAAAVSDFTQQTVTITVNNNHYLPRPEQTAWIADGLTSSSGVIINAAAVAGVDGVTFFYVLSGNNSEHFTMANDGSVTVAPGTTISASAVSIYLLTITPIPRTIPPTGTLILAVEDWCSSSVDDSTSDRSTVRVSPTGSGRDSTTDRSTVRDSITGTSTVRGSITDRSTVRGSTTDTSTVRGSTTDSSTTRGTSTCSCTCSGSSVPVGQAVVAILIPVCFIFGIKNVLR